MFLGFEQRGKRRRVHWAIVPTPKYGFVCNPSSRWTIKHCLDRQYLVIDRDCTLALYTHYWSVTKHVRCKLLNVCVTIILLELQHHQSQNHPIESTREASNQNLLWNISIVFCAKVVQLGSGCGTDDSAVASDTRGHGLESSHRQLLFAVNSF